MDFGSAKFTNPSKKVPRIPSQLKLQNTTALHKIMDHGLMNHNQHQNLRNFIYTNEETTDDENLKSQHQMQLVNAKFTN